MSPVDKKRLLPLSARWFREEKKQLTLDSWDHRTMDLVMSLVDWDHRKDWFWCPEAVDMKLYLQNLDGKTVAAL